MKPLNWELQVLSRAILYNNLSGAAQHVGISQPQLSRIVKKIEAEWGIPILNRETKRKSTWTADAVKLSELYNKTTQTWQAEVAAIGIESEPTHLRVGTLEGLVPLANELIRALYKLPSTEAVELDVHDLSSLEESFFKGYYDFVFSSREPGHRKYPYLHTLGYQLILPAQGPKSKVDRDLSVMSTYEWGLVQGSPKKSKGTVHKKLFISNSLEVRRYWIQNMGGTGALPSEVSKKPQSQKSFPVILIGNDRLSKTYWNNSLAAL